MRARHLGDRSGVGARTVVVTKVQVVGARAVDNGSAAAERINGYAVGIQVQGAVDGDIVAGTAESRGIANRERGSDSSAADPRRRRAIASCPRYLALAH